MKTLHGNAARFDGEIDEINECRRLYGMAPIELKEILCKNCKKPFLSWDVKKERHCRVCNEIRYHSNTGSMGER